MMDEAVRMDRHSFEVEDVADRVGGGRHDA